MKGLIDHAAAGFCLWAMLMGVARYFMTGSPEVAFISMVAGVALGVLVYRIRMERLG